MFQNHESQADMAKLLGVSALSVYNWEGGKAKPRGKSWRLSWTAWAGEAGGAG